MKNNKLEILWNYIDKAVSVEDNILTIENADIFLSIPEMFGFGEKKKNPLDAILTHIGEYGNQHLKMNKFVVKTGPYIINFEKDKVNSSNDNPAIVMVTSGDLIFTRRWYKDGVLHRDDDKPALVDKIPIEEFPRLISWYKDGVLHRDGDKPALMEFWSEFKIAKAFWYKKGKKIAEINVTNDGEIKTTTCDDNLNLEDYTKLISQPFPNNTFPIEQFYCDINKTYSYE